MNKSARSIASLRELPEHAAVPVWYGTWKSALRLSWCIGEILATGERQGARLPFLADRRAAQQLPIPRAGRPGGKQLGSRSP